MKRRLGELRPVASFKFELRWLPQVCSRISIARSMAKFLDADSVQALSMVRATPTACTHPLLKFASVKAHIHMQLQILNLLRSHRVHCQTPQFLKTSKARITHPKNATTKIALLVGKPTYWIMHVTPLKRNLMENTNSPFTSYFMKRKITLFYGNTRPEQSDMCIFLPII
jgi:hypothetical protein